MELTVEEKKLLELGRVFAGLGASPELGAEAADDWVRQRGRRLLPEKPKEAPDEEGKIANFLAGVNLGGAPRLPIFSGSQEKSEVSFNLYAYEVRCLALEHDSAVVMQAIRRSLRGQAAEVLLHLGKNASVEVVLAKLEVVFGDVLPAEAVLEAFYAAKQKPHETVAIWSCRLEGLLEQVKRKEVTDQQQSQDMLKTKFWSGLRDSSIKAALRHQVSKDRSYDELLRLARTVEDEITPKSDAKTCAVQDPVLTQLQEIGRRLNSIEDRLKEVEVAQKPMEEKRRSCYNCGVTGHLKKDCPHLRGNGTGPTAGGAL